MIFPISDLLNVSESTAWLEQHFHPEGLRCPHCEATREEARHFRTTRRGLADWRCRKCHTVFNVYTGTVFEKSGWSPVNAVLLIRGVCKGETSKGLAEELGVSRTTVLLMRQRLQANGYATRQTTPLPDTVTETDEMFQNAGKKSEPHLDPDDPPRRRANKRKGHGTYENDRPPIIGTFGRASGQVRLAVIAHTDKPTLQHHVTSATQTVATCYTDEWRGYEDLPRTHATVCHGQHEWARDDDGDGIKEVHTNTSEGGWTSLRNFLRPFRGVHKKNLKYYVAMCEHRINRKRISPTFICQLVTQRKHESCT